MTGALEVIGRVVVHFVWQGALVALLAAAVLALLRRRGPEARYAACCVALVAMIALPVATAAILATDPGALGPTEPGETTRRSERIPAGSLVPTDPLAPLLPWIATFWLGGVSALQLRTVYWWLCMRRLRRTGVSALPGDWERRVAVLRRRLDLRTSVKVVRSSVAAVPMVIGWLRPVVLVPVQAFTGLDTEQLRAILAHELAHVRRHDCWINLLQIGLETTFFYHPAVWWISRRLRIEREYCCDDLAAQVCGDTVVVARALGRLEALRDPSPALGATGGSLMQRIERLIDRNDRPRPRSLSAATGVALASFVLATGLVAGLTLAAAEAPPPPPPTAPIADVPAALAAPATPPTATAPPARPATLAPVATTPRAARPALPAPPPPRVQRCEPSEPSPDTAPVVVEIVPVAAFPADDCPVSEPVLATVPEPDSLPWRLERRPVAPAPESASDAEIQRQIDEIRELRQQLEEREQRLIRMLEKRESEATAPVGDVPEPTVLIRSTAPPRRVVGERPTPTRLETKRPPNPILVRKFDVQELKKSNPDTTPREH